MVKFLDKIVEIIYLYILPLFVALIVGFNVFTDTEASCNRVLLIIAAACACKAVILLYEIKNKDGNN